MEKIEMTCRCGATASIESTVVSYMAKDWQKNHEDCKYLEQQPTTAEPTPTAPTQGPQWDAGRCKALNCLCKTMENPEGCPNWVTVSTTPTTLPSSLSDQADTKSGPVEQNCKCAPLHTSVWWFRHPQEDKYEIVKWCNNCGALTLYGKTLVLVADPTSSTLVKQASSESVESSVEESVKSQSKPTSFEDVCRFVVLQDSHCILKVGHKGLHTDSFGEHPAPIEGRMGYN